jgi:hypothetical protein
MRKPSASDNLTSAEKKGAEEAALAAGLEPVGVFKSGPSECFWAERKRIIIDWGRKMGFEASDSLRIAQSGNLIASSRPPRETAGGSPR